ARHVTRRRNGVASGPDGPTGAGFRSRGRGRGSVSGPALAPAVRPPPREGALPGGELAVRGDQRDLPASARHVRPSRGGWRGGPRRRLAHSHSHGHAAGPAPPVALRAPPGEDLRSRRTRGGEDPPDPAFGPVAGFYRDRLERLR